MAGIAQYAYALYDTELLLKVFLFRSINLEMETLIVCVLDWVRQWIHNLFHVLPEHWISTHIFTKLVDNSYVVSVCVWYRAHYFCWIILSNFNLGVVVWADVTPVLWTAAWCSSCMKGA